MPNDLVRLSEFSSSSAVAISTAEGTIEISVSDALKWIAPNAPETEALKFLFICRAAQVNPLLGEAHLIEMGGRWTTVIDKSGYLKRAQQNRAYDGHEAGIIVQHLDPETKVRGRINEIEGSWLPPDHIVIGGWARIYRKDRDRPTTIRVSIQEYNKGTGTWKTITCTMIRKVALVQGLRESGLISTGWYDGAEVGQGGINEVETREVDVRKAIKANDRPTSPPDLRSNDEQPNFDQIAELVETARDAGMTDDQFRSALARRGVDDPAKLSMSQYYELMGKLTPLAIRNDPLKHTGLDKLMQPAGMEASNPTDDFIVADAPRRGEPEAEQKTVNATVEVVASPIADDDDEDIPF